MTDQTLETQFTDVVVDCSLDLPATPSFQSLFEVEFAYVYNTLRRLGVRTYDLEDLAHEVFVVVHQTLARFDPSRPMRPWLFGIAFRVASDYRRRARYTRELPEEAASEPTDHTPLADEQIATAQARQLVLDALAALDLDRRAVVVMHDLDGTPVPQIADALSIPLNTAYSRLRLGREQFKAAVKRLRLGRGEQ